MNLKTCGREASNELVLDDASVSRLHARIELTGDGSVCLSDAGSNNGTYLHRNDNWIRIRKVTLCVGDRIRFGDIEIPLERIVAVFGHRSNARLGAKPAALTQARSALKSFARQSGQGPVLNKPKRNPVTGKIEEQRPDQITQT